MPKWRSAQWNLSGSIPLLVALVVLFFLESVTDHSRLIGVAYAAVLMVSAWTMSHDRRHLTGSLALVSIALVARLIYEVSPGRGTILLSHGCGIAFLTWSAYFIFQRAGAASGRVGKDRIAGAICVYLMMGVVGGTLASSVETVHPGSFRFPDGSGADQAPYTMSRSSVFLYFSFVTLATLGYGDITPVTPLARTFSWMLAVVGQMYVAIVVARLVSLGFSSPGPPKE